MNIGRAKSIRLEQLLASTLNYGTILASAVIAVGLLLAPISTHAMPSRAVPSAASVVTAGIALFILLPVFRVLVMMVMFTRMRDYRFGAVATLVLAIITLGFVFGSFPTFQL
jgi:uncharacterized membrane protein